MIDQLAGLVAVPFGVRRRRIDVPRLDGVHDRPVLLGDHGERLLHALVHVQQRA